MPKSEVAPAHVQANEVPAIRIKVEDNDEAPLREVPPLPRTGEHRTIKPTENGHRSPKQDVPEEQS